MNERPYRRLGQTLSCPVCGTTFYKKRAELREVNYCSVSCSAKANMRLRPTAKGERRAPGTEFQPGGKPHNHVPVGAVRIRTRHGRGGVQRAFVKVAEPNVWRERAHIVYEQSHGPRTRGRVIHHINTNPLDDSPDNLVELTRAEHVAVHAGTSSSGHSVNRPGY